MATCWVNNESTALGRGRAARTEKRVWIMNEPVPESHDRRFSNAGKCDTRGFHRVRRASREGEYHCIDCNKKGDAGWAARQGREENR